MKHRLKRLIPFSVLLLFAATDIHGEVLGRGFLAGEVGGIWPDDPAIKAISKNILFYGVFVNVPVLPGLDLHAEVERRELRSAAKIWEDRVDTDYVVAGGRVHFLPGRQINPYVEAAVVWSRIGTRTLAEIPVEDEDEEEEENGDTEEDLPTDENAGGGQGTVLSTESRRMRMTETDVGMRVGAGVEIQASPIFSVLLGISRLDVFDESPILGQVMLNFRPIEDLMFFARYRYDFDSNDQSISGGLALGF